MNTLFEFSRKRIAEVPTDFVRYMYDRIKWQGRMLGLMGPRGVGKTTLLLQPTFKIEVQSLEGDEVGVSARGR